MKKIIYFFFLASVLLFACNRSTESVSLDAQYELEDETQKHAMAVKVVRKRGKTAIDAFGNPIMEGRWYGVVNSTKAFFPISWAHSMGSFNFDSRHEVFYPHLIIKLEKARILASNALHGAGGSPVDVEILLLGPNKKIIFLNEMEISGEIKVKIVEQ